MTNHQSGLCPTRSLFHTNRNMGIGMTLLFAALGVFTCVDGVGMPLHAQCTVNWTFGVSCKEVSGKIANQFKIWEGSDGCKDGGEKCLYKLTSSSDTDAKGTHETPVKHYVDDLTFTLSQDTPACKVKGYSRSETWYAVLDYGTNYCNLHNLITGAGLDKVSGYSEKTSNSICTQFSSADCTVY